MHGWNIDWQWPRSGPLGVPKLDGAGLQVLANLAVLALALARARARKSSPSVKVESTAREQIVLLVATRPLDFARGFRIPDLMRALLGRDLGFRGPKSLLTPRRAGDELISRGKVSCHFVANLPGITSLQSICLLGEPPKKRRIDAGKIDRRSQKRYRTTSALFEISCHLLHDRGLVGRKKQVWNHEQIVRWRDSVTTIEETFKMADEL